MMMWMLRYSRLPRDSLDEVRSLLLMDSNERNYQRDSKTIGRFLSLYECVVSMIQHHHWSALGELDLKLV